MADYFQLHCSATLTLTPFSNHYQSKIKCLHLIKSRGTPQRAPDAAAFSHFLQSLSTFLSLAQDALSRSRSRLRNQGTGKRTQCTILPVTQVHEYIPPRTGHWLMHRFATCRQCRLGDARWLSITLSGNKRHSGGRCLREVTKQFLGRIGTRAWRRFNQ